MRRTRRSATLSAGSLLLASLTACSGGGADVENDPEQALSDAIEALADYDGIELVVAIDGDREAIIAASEGDLDGSEVSLLLDSSIQIRAAGEDETDAQAEVIVDLAGQPAFELRYLPESELFLRLDLDAISDAVDDPSFGESIEEAVDAAGQFGLGEVAAAVRDGSWIKLTGVEQFAEFARSPRTEEPSEEEVEDVQERIVGAMQDFLESDVTVAYQGEEEAGERVTATTTQAALAGLLDEISTIASDLSGVDGDQFGLDSTAGEGSDEPVEIDLWIADGRLSQLGFDLSALAEDEGEGAPEGTFLLVAIDEFDGSVTAPDESTEVDLFAIFGTLMGGGLGGMDAGALEIERGPGQLDDEGALDEGEPADGGDPLGGDCIPQEQIDQLTGGDPDAEAELQGAIDAGLIEVC
ncbi:MAG: hypothetical protein WD010_01245 [Nitriliruptor sp.]|uniref:hypothetical protein n=1 Tax=Nitriliruptor sp. TaxID=2448056 RepID=UPI0034A02084